MTTAKDLSVIIPAYNEAQRLPSHLSAVIAYLQSCHPSHEVIVVDDGSSDGTAQVVQDAAAGNPGLRLIRLPGNRGKGHAIRTGMLAAEGKLRLFTDADGATPITELERLLRQIDAGASVAIASRVLRDPDCVLDTHLHRKCIGTIFNCIVKMVALRGIGDTQCGFKLFTAAAAGRIFSAQRLEGFGFDVEILFLARKFGYRIAETPVTWRDVEGSKVDLLRDPIRMFRDILAVRLYDLTGRYR